MTPARRVKGRRFPRRVAAIVLVAICVAFGAAACGSGSNSTAGSQPGTSTATGASADSAVSAARSALEDLTKGTGTAPPSTGPKAVRGKSVWVVSCDQEAECANISQGVVDASKILGWHARVCDGANDANNAFATCMGEAIAAKASGIITVAIDCSLMKQPLMAARAAHIPVIGAFSFDCNQETPQAGSSLLTTTVLQSANYPTGRDIWAKIGDYVGDSVISATNGKANVVTLSFTTSTAGSVSANALTSTLATCDGCKVYNVVIAPSQATPQGIAALAQSALLKHPDANVLASSVGTFIELGGATAAKTSGRNILVATAAENSEAMDFVKSGEITEDIAYDLEWEGWAAADTLNRVFAGASEVPEGVGLQFVSKTVNFPSSGQFKYVGIDYQKAYENVWLGHS